MNLTALLTCKPDKMNYKVIWPHFTVNSRENEFGLESEKFVYKNRTYIIFIFDYIVNLKARNM